MTDNLKYYKQRLKIKQATFSKIDHDNAMVAVVYEVCLLSGKKYILKICPKERHYFREIYCLKKLSSVTAAPNIIDLVDPDEKHHGAILMEYLSGNLIRRGGLSTRLAHDIGFNLAKFHDITMKGYGDLLDSSELSSDPEKYWLKKFNESIGECHGPINSDLIEQVLSFTNENIHLLKKSDGPCIAHRDFRPGNIIVNQNKLSGIIDWASARAGFAQEDFQAFEEKEWSNSSDVNDAFLKGYAVVRPVPDYKEMFPLLRLERALGLVGYTLKIGTWNGIHSKLFKENLIAVP